MQEFNFVPGAHDVWLLPNSDCDFTLGTQLEPTGGSPVTFALTKQGTYYFGCSISGHCEVGMMLTVEVGDEGKNPALTPRSSATPPGGPVHSS